MNELTKVSTPGGGNPFENIFQDASFEGHAKNVKSRVYLWEPGFPGGVQNI
jgi:hypothetical protein